MIAGLSPLMVMVGGVVVAAWRLNFASRILEGLTLLRGLVERWKGIGCGLDRDDGASLTRLQLSRLTDRSLGISFDGSVSRCQ